MSNLAFYMEAVLVSGFRIFRLRQNSGMTASPTLLSGEPAAQNHPTYSMDSGMTEADSSRAGLRTGKKENPLSTLYGEGTKFALEFTLMVYCFPA